MANDSPEIILGILFDVEAQKIDGTMLNTYGLVVAAFSVTNKANRSFGMPSLTLSSTNVDFLDGELRWKTYTIQAALPNTRRVELVGKKELQLQSLTQSMGPT